MGTISDAKPIGRGILTKTTWGVVVGVLILALLKQADLFAELTPLFLSQALGLLGVSSEANAGTLIVAGREVPWSSECSGFNAALLLMSVTLWVNRRSGLSLGLGLRLGGVLLSAFILNIGRVLTILAYRGLRHPVEESPELHMLIGFLWMLPVLPWLVPKADRSSDRQHGWIEMLTLCVVFALLCPMLEGPGALWVGATTLAMLSLHRGMGDEGPPGMVWILAFAVAAVMIWNTSMDSLWLPWILLNPWTLPLKRSTVFVALTLLPGTVPVFAMRFEFQLLAVAGLAYVIWIGSNRQTGASRFVQEAMEATRPSLSGGLCAGILLLAPFYGAAIPVPKLEQAPLPNGCMIQKIETHAYSVRLPIQRESLQIFWFTGSGSDRHHSLVVCMKYRGVDLEPKDREETLWTDGTLWYREYYLCDSKLLATYSEYLAATLIPKSDKGVHVIMTSPRTETPRETFLAETDDLATRLVRDHWRRP